MIEIEGDKGTFVDTKMKADIDHTTGYLTVEKGFMSLVMSKFQTEELRKMLNRHAKMDEEKTVKTECCQGSLWVTPLGRIVLDDHNCETFCEPYDKKIMTKEELSNGIKLHNFEERLNEIKSSKK